MDEKINTIETVAVSEPVKFEDRIISPMTYRNDVIREDMKYFPVGLVFEEEYGPIPQKYGLNHAYRDIIVIPKEEYDKFYKGVETFTINDGTLVPMISIRAMHRILFADISIDNLHFLANPHLRSELLDYDKEHGAFFQFLINKVEYPKTLFTLRFRLPNSDDIAIAMVDRIEQVMSVEGSPALLVYGHEADSGNNYTIYVNDVMSPSVELTFYKNQEVDKKYPAEEPKKTEVTEDGTGTI